MKAMVVYDSVFGNTEQVAQAIGRALGSPEDVRVVQVANVRAEELAGVELLVVGSPTRGFRATPATVSFLRGIPARGLQGARVAAFDTRISMRDPGIPGILRLMVKAFGYAAKPIADQLERKGGRLAAPPEGFFVNGSEGPLNEGELERAASWARQIAAA